LDNKNFEVNNKMKNKILICMIAMLMLSLTLVMSADLTIYKQQETLSIEIPCLVNGSNKCDPSTNCTLNIADDMKQLVVDNAQMIADDYVMTYDFINATPGVYEMFMTCIAPDNQTGYLQDTFKITSTGQEGFEAGTSPTGDSLWLTFLMAGILLVFTILGQTTFKVGVMNVILGIGWMGFGYTLFYTNILIGCIIGCFGILLAVYSFMEGL